jgi:hypothetical protein
MTLGIGSGDPIVGVVVANVPALFMVTGTGADIVESWPIGSYMTETLNFANGLSELGKVPISGFDSRTNAASALFPGVVSAGAYSAVGNTNPTHQFRLIDRFYNGSHLILSAKISGAPTALSLPSSLILAGEPGGFAQLAVEFGSTGFRIVSLSGTTVNYQTTITKTLVANDDIKVIRLKNLISIYVNGIFVWEGSHATFSATGNPGFGTYSTTGSVISTKISSFTVRGSSDRAYAGIGQEFIRRINLPSSGAWYEVARGYVAVGGTRRISIDVARWTNSTSLSTRSFSLKLNGTEIGVVADQNGGSVVINSITIPNNSILTVDAYSSSGVTENRTISQGSIQVTAA